MESYSMTKETSGIVYVFNHVGFDNGSLGVRHGAIRDSKNIEKTFGRLNFNVHVYKDLKYSEILQKLTDIAETDYSNLDCVVIFVLTHGRNGKVFAKDVDYYPDIYWKTLNDTNVSLSSKPKLVFVQAPRGDEVGDGTKLGPATFPIPDAPDVLLMYSCYDEFFSWQRVHTGTWIMYSLCKELRKQAGSTDVLTLLTSLNGKLGPHISGDKTRGQIATIVSTLTKLLYFKPKNK